MRYFLSQHIPPFCRVLLVESGSRYLLEDLLPGLYATHPELERADLVTCFPGQPATFDHGKGEILRVSGFVGRQGRASLYRLLQERRYDVIGILCTGEPIMTKWKWVLAWKVPGKLFILNENGDYFWFDRGNLDTIRHFALFRMGLAGASAITTIARLVAFPFTLAYLLLFAAVVHLRRWART